MCVGASVTTTIAVSTTRAESFTPQLMFYLGFPIRWDPSMAFLRRF